MVAFESFARRAIAVAPLSFHTTARCRLTTSTGNTVVHLAPHRQHASPRHALQTCQEGREAILAAMRGASLAAARRPEALMHNDIAPSSSEETNGKARL